MSLGSLDQDNEKKKYMYIFLWIRFYILEIFYAITCILLKEFHKNNWGSLVAQMVKNLPTVPGDPGSIPGSGRSPGERNGHPL